MYLYHWKQKATINKPSNKYSYEKNDQKHLVDINVGNFSMFLPLYRRFS